MRRANTDCEWLRDYIWKFMDANDRLLVSCLDSDDWASYRALVNPETV